jgi:hypothetical protein
MKQLLNFGKVLSRDQMKNITGGVTCTWTNVSGFQSEGSCSGDAQWCQGVADQICAGQDRCDDVNCE